MTAARLVASLLVLPLLYFLLGEKEEGWGGTAAAIARRAFFALLGTLVFFQLTARWTPASESGGEGRGFQAFFQGSYFFRLGHTHMGGLVEGGKGAPLGARAYDELRKAVASAPDNTYYRRYLGIALADRGDYAEALRTLEETARRMEPRAPQRAAEERELWRALYGTPAPDRAALESARRRLEGYRLGWIGRVALLAAYRRLGPGAAPKELRARVSDEARHFFQGLLSGILVPLWIVPQLGLIALGVGITLIRQGVLRPAPRRQHAVTGILWESFILSMALYMAPGFIAFGPKRSAAGAAPLQIAALLLVGDLLQIAAVFYLWARLRGRGLSLAELGLTTRHLGPNVLIGVGAATIVMPAAMLLGIVTQFLSDRLFPNVAPPYHPLSGMTATSGSLEIRWALFLAAAVGAPLVEETFFRGALFGALRRRFGYWPGLLASAGFFAILHPQLPLGFLPIALLGAVFAVLYDWRQSLVPGIVAHAVNNGLTFLLLNLTFPPQ